MQSRLLNSFAAVLLIAIPITASPAKKYSNCAQLHKAYPKGVANSRAAAKRTGAAYNPKVYNENKGKDRDKDGVACEVVG